MTRDGDVIGWVKYIDHNGSKATELVLCNPDDEGAIPVCRLSDAISHEKALLEKIGKLEKEVKELNAEISDRNTEDWHDMVERDLL